MKRRVFLQGMLGLSVTALCGAKVWSAPSAAPRTPVMQKRWLFFWRDMSNPADVDRTIALFPKAQANGYNAIVIGANVAPAKAAELKQAAKKYGLGIVAMVMGGAPDKNYWEGFPSKNALFVAKSGMAVFQSDSPTQLKNGDFEDMNGDHANGWGFQDDEGTVSAADHSVFHSGKSSLRMDINQNKKDWKICRLIQKIQLQPHRQYRINFWLKSEGLSGGTSPEVKVISADNGNAISYQTFHTDGTQDWKEYNIVFNSMDSSNANVYLGTWGGQSGKFWWDDVHIEEIALVNMLRRPGCPVTVQADGGGTVYEEGRDYEKIVDDRLHPWNPYHDPPAVHLTSNTRIPEGQKLRVSYYHTVLVYEDRVNPCLSEPRVFEGWHDEVKTANDLYHPEAFFMEHDELREMNQCGSCQAKHMTAGELLAWNIHKAAGIIRDLRPNAGIWVWSDMFDPYHNAKDNFYLVNGSLKGSWKGLDKDIGIVNWNGGGLDKDVKWFSDLGLRQILSGYYDDGGDNDGSKIAKWIDSAKGMPGVVGAMYTTWGDNYGPMDVWAQKAWGKPAAPAA